MLELLNTDGNMITNLYWDQLAAVQIGSSLSYWIALERGLRQGCNISPDHRQGGSREWSKT